MVKFTNMKGFIMRVFFSLSILIMLLSTCPGTGQVPTNAYDVLFFLNTDGRTAQYELRMWAGADTTQASNIANYTAVGLYSHSTLQTQFPGSGSQARLTDVYSSPENGQYLKAALRAVSPTNQVSAWAYSKSYKKVDLTPPQKPQFAGIGIGY